MKRILIAIVFLSSGYALAVDTVKMSVDVSKVKHELSQYLYGTGMEDVNHEIYGGLDAQRLFGESFEEPIRGERMRGVSASWDKAEAIDGGDFVRATNFVHQGSASQQLLPNGGVASIANRGLCRWGVPCRAGRRMKGYLWTHGRVDRLEVALQDYWGERTYALAAIETSTNEVWRKAEFTLAPDATDPHGRFLVRASGKGEVWIDDVYLADEPTNEFGRLGCREDLVAGMREEGVTFLRWGGSMANAKHYRLKNMRGKGERMPYRGFWYYESSGGFGPYEFVRMAEAMKLPCAVSINAYEETSDAVEFAEWLKEIKTPVYVQIGNEELTGWGGNREDSRTMKGVTNYCDSTLRLVKAMRNANPKLKFVHAAMWMGERGLDLLKETFRRLDGVVEYWDVHVSVVGPDDTRKSRNQIRNALKLMREWNPKTTMKVAIFEENGRNHGLDRALGHAVMMETVREMGDDLLTSCPANAFQPYLHNDNWWDQGSVFFTTDKVWLSPCGYAQKMASDFHREQLVASGSDSDKVSVSATKSRDGKSVVLHIVNSLYAPRKLELSGLADMRLAKVMTLTGPSDRANNIPENPTRISPQDITATFSVDKTLPSYSYTILEFTR